MEKLTPNEIEAANRAEITARLIRLHYRVYRPEANCSNRYSSPISYGTPNLPI